MPMRKFRETNIIPQSSTERLLPVEVLHNGYIRQISIMHGGLSILRSGARIERNENRDYHIVIISIRGSGRFIMESGETFTLGPGSLFFSNALGQGHRHLPVSSEWELCWMHIDRNAEWLFSPVPDYEVRPCQEWDEIRGCLNSLLMEDILRQKEFGEIENLQSQLLFQYLKRALLTENYRGKQLQYLKNFNNLWNEVSLHSSKKWNLDEICDYVHLSKAQATRICNTLFHASPAEKVCDIKLKQAFALLSNLNFSVSATAELIGYESISSFSVAFKNKFGFSPKEAGKHLQ